MSMKIAKPHADAMNELYRDELRRAGYKIAAEDKSLDAYKDHAEYEAVLESVLKEDKTESFDPNDPLLD